MRTMARQIGRSLSASSVDFRLIEPAPGPDWPFWPEVRELLARAFFDATPFADVYRRMATGQAQLWIGKKECEIVLAVVTEIAWHSGRYACNVAGIGGKGMKDWIGHLAAIEAWAGQRGCHVMLHNNARPGFARVLKDYRTVRVTLEKELR